MKPTTPNDYADLIVPMAGCCFGKAIYACPFRRYWLYKSLEDRIQLLKEMKPFEQMRLRQFHQQCIRLKRMSGTVLRDVNL